MYYLLVMKYIYCTNVVRFVFEINYRLYSSFKFCIFKITLIIMVAYFCHHLSDNNVNLSDFDVDLSDIYVDLSDHYVDLSEKYLHN